MRMSWLYFASRSERAERAGLDLPAVGGHREVGDGRVLGFARAVRHDRGHPARWAISTASRVSVSVPIWLTLTRIELAMPFGDPVGETALGIGDEQVVADQLHLLRPAPRSAFSSRPSHPRRMPSSIETIG
jgi:hypothetical protein